MKKERCDLFNLTKHFSRIERFIQEICIAFVFPGRETSRYTQPGENTSNDTVYNNRGYGAAIVVCMLVVILVLTKLLQASEKKWVFYN